MSVRQAILDFTGGEIRPRIFVAPSIPDKKLAAAKSQFAFGDEKIIALYDDTLFGSGKDGIAVTESYIYSKQLWENPRSVRLSSIETITTESKLLDNLDIFVNGNFFTSISSLPKTDQPFLLGLLLAARDAAAEPKAQRKKASSADGAPQTAAPKTKAKGRKSEPTLGCSECSAQLPKGAKFCLECGAKVMPKGVCLECNAKLPEKAKFCPECGAAAGKIASQPAQPKVSADELRKELALWLSASEIDARIDSDGDLSLNISAPAPSFARDTRGWIGRYDLRIDAEGVNAETTQECTCFGPNDEFSVSSPYCRVGMQASAAYDVAMKLQVYTLDELEIQEIELREGPLAIPKLSSSRVRITSLSARRDDDGSYEIAYELDAYAGHAVHFQVSAEKPDADSSAWARVEDDGSQSGLNWLWDVKPGQKLYLCFGEYELFVEGVEALFSGTAEAPESGIENSSEYDGNNDEAINQAEKGDTMNFDLKVVYQNADTGDIDEQIITISTDNEEIIFLGTICSARQTHQTFEELFKAMYDNPTMDGIKKGALYDEIWPIMSQWAFDKLGWHDVTVDVIGLTIDDEDTNLERSLEIGLIENRDWAIQLSREGFMYCYV